MISQNKDGALKAFFAAKHYAVVGASADESKYGFKVFKWYVDHKLPVSPINPKADEILEVKTVKSLSKLASPHETSVSIITPAKVTIGVLQEAEKLNVPAVWVQPGAFDDTCNDFFRQSSSMECIAGGRCILIEGEHGLALQDKM